MERLIQTTQIRNCLPHYFDGSLIVSSGNRLFRIHDLAQPKLEFIGQIPWRIDQRISHFRLLDRILKNGIYLLHPDSAGGHLVATGKGWWHLDGCGDSRMVQLPSHSRPLSRGIYTDDDGVTYISEYTPNLDRNPAHIWKTRDFISFEVAWKFGAGSIRHVHALIPDQRRNGRILVLTGDLDHESVIWITDDLFESLDPYLALGQVSRATDLTFVNDEIIWGMDSPLEVSYILKYSAEHQGKPEMLFELPGPAYYSSVNEAGGIYFGTTAEPGPSVKDDCAHIIASSPNGEWGEIHKSKSDFLPQFGIIYFPRGVLPENWVVFHQRGTRPNEGFMTIARDTAWR